MSDKAMPAPGVVSRPILRLRNALRDKGFGLAGNELAKSPSDSKRCGATKAGQLDWIQESGSGAAPKNSPQGGRMEISPPLPDARSINSSH
ncbi:hypothetical protein [Devosia sp.]|uniref:hypothetical protein n=1 Tax=Devosia sp. TaxID=1871048 RepID=UPI002F1D77FA